MTFSAVVRTRGAPLLRGVQTTCASDTACRACLAVREPRSHLAHRDTSRACFLRSQRLVEGGLVLRGEVREEERASSVVDELAEALDLQALRVGVELFAAALAHYYERSRRRRTSAAVSSHSVGLWEQRWRNGIAIAQLCDLYRDAPARFRVTDEPRRTSKTRRARCSQLAAGKTLEAPQNAAAARKRSSASLNTQRSALF